MTICIAALCEGGKKIILASDRMVTVGEIIEFEHDVPKFDELSKNSIIMTAGSTTLQNDIIQLAKKEINTITLPTFNQITDKVKEAYVGTRIKRAEELYLKPKGLNLSTFYQSQKMLLPEVIFKISDEIDRSSLRVEYILCGFGDNQGHINYIYDPGVSESFDSVGFCSIGSGNINATSAFTAHNYAPSFSVEKALYLVYLAKKEAERAPGVGDAETDITILSNDGCYHLKSNEKKILEDTYKKYIKIEDAEYNDVRDEIIAPLRKQNAIK